MIASKTPEPLPGDPSGKRLCKIFGTYPWQAIQAATPEAATQKPKWSTITKYPLRPRVLWNLWQDAATLIGVRFDRTTSYALIDLDAGSAYHSTDAIAQIRAALETIGITRTGLRIESEKFWSLVPDGFITKQSLKIGQVVSRSRWLKSGLNHPVVVRQNDEIS